MKTNKMYLTEAEAKAAGLPSMEEQIRRHNQMVCKHQRVGTTDNVHEYECMDCDARIPREVR